MITYEPIDGKEVPRDVRFDCTGPDCGQFVEVEYGDFGRAEHGRGSLYRRTRDTSIAGCNTPWSYERLVPT